MHDRTVIRAAIALVGRALEPVDDVVVTLDGDRIVSIDGGDAASADEVDASDLALLPGFIDAHVHMGFYSPADIVRGGVTTARDLASPPQEIWSLVEASRERDFDGPRLLAVGQMLTAADGYPMRARWARPGTGLEVLDAGRADAAVARQAGAGACAIKVALNAAVGPTLDARTLRAIVAAAHARGLNVTAHIHGLDELDKALDAGVDELAHVLMSADAVPDETLQRMIADDVTVVPTLSIFFGAEQRIAISNTARFVAMGGRVVYGTDLGNEGPRPGIDPREVSALNAAGLGPRAIVAAATTEAADYLGLEGVGVIEEGADADLVTVPRAALARPDALCDVQMVWRKGARLA